MICSILHERLGNILFEIADGASLAKQLNVPFAAYVNPGDPKYTAYVSQYKKTILRKINHLEELPLKQTEYIEPFFHYQVLPQIPHLSINGYFQSEKYFDKELVRELFTMDDDMKLYIEQKYGEILRRKPVSIHIRRGDYLKLKLLYTICTERYYRQAIQHFPPETYYLIISDDIDWCKQHFKGEHFFFSENESPLTDLYLQSCCRHHIISNSTFAWWGAWLNPHPDKRVICPDPWFQILYRKQNTKDLLPEGWIRLPVRKNMVEKIEYYYLLLKHCYRNPYKVYLEIRKRIKM